MKFKRGQLVRAYDWTPQCSNAWMLSVYVRREDPYHLVWNIARGGATICGDREIRHLKPNVG